MTEEIKHLVGHFLVTADIIFIAYNLRKAVRRRKTGEDTNVTKFKKILDDNNIEYEINFVNDWCNDEFRLIDYVITIHSKKEYKNKIFALKDIFMQELKLTRLRISYDDYTSIKCEEDIYGHSFCFEMWHEEIEREDWWNELKLDIDRKKAEKNGYICDR
jgi:hypothetical protein